MSEEKQPNPNMALWTQVCVTDPKHVKPITGKDYGGNSPKPYWIIQRLTEVFGPCGIGWGYAIESERFERFSDTDTLHVAMVRLWYVLDGKRGEVVQMGQTKATYMTSKGSFKVDEDAPKKSVTDALVKCASYLGFAGDIFSGRWDDSKYVAWAREQYAEDDKKDPIPDTFRSSPTMGALDDVDDPDKILYLTTLASTLVAQVDKGHIAEAYERLLREKLDDTDYPALWEILKPKSYVRSKLKAHGEALRATKKAAAEGATA